MKRKASSSTSNAQSNGRSPGKPRKPDFHVWAADTRANISGDIGAAWINEDGTIHIKLNPFVVIDTGVQDMVVKLYPCDKGE